MKLRSIRFKMTATTVAVVLAIFLSVVGVSYSFIRTAARRHSVEMLRMVSREVQNTLDDYFISIQQSVDMAANEAIDSLDSVLLVECGAAGSQAGVTARTAEQTQRLDSYLEEYCRGIQKAFESVASHTHGSITYYYCIAPQVSESVHGFYYSRVGKAGFVAQTPLDAGALSLEGEALHPWYFTPISRGRPSWLGPYTDRVLGDIPICSYLVPIYSAGTLVGVLGMDIAMDTLVEQVSPIRVYETGFASLCQPDGTIIYHPELSAGANPSLTGLPTPSEITQLSDSGNALIRYTAGNGEKRQMSFTTLRNGMKLVVTAPVREINASWLRVIRIVLIISAAAIAVYAVVLAMVTGLLTRPLRRLTAAAQRLANEDYDAELTYRSRDEVGELTEAFRQMRDKQKETMEDLRRRVYMDDLTGLPNLRRFFTLGKEGREALAREGKNSVILYFNLGGLKHYNRQYGFMEGNELIRAVAEVLARHFGKERVCRVGQDHFAAVAAEEGLEETLRAVLADCQGANWGRSLPVHVGVYPDRLEAVPVNTACDRAKYACDRRRGQVDSGFTYFSPDLHRQANRARYVVSHIDQALRENWIQVYYQPLIRAVNQKVCDEEALARWIDPELGLLCPADFIPTLEDAGLIYKLDLYVLEQALEKIRRQQELGVPAVPHSVNLSRSDFDACDMVEEIRRRVDASGLPRHMITIEITESIIGRDFDYMKRQVERFRSLGFPVWMDDFGSGYSSLDVLQSIKFDLLKFDMSFMRKLDQGTDGKIILTKLMEMATAIGVDTVCEGVETEEQKEFLQEIGCSKLQGYLFSRPLPADRIIERNLTKLESFGFENAEESAYYEAVGRVNLYDLGVIASDESDALRHAFSTLPMGIIEIRGDTSRFMRSNQSYRDFIQRFFDIDITKLGPGYGKYDAAFMENVVKTCCEQGLRAFYDDKMPDGSTVHSFARRISVNPVNGNIAVAVAVLSVTEPIEEGTTYAEIAQALAADYYNIYVIDLDTDQFVEYSSSVGGDELAVVRRGEGFFEAVKRDSLRRIYAEDQAEFSSAFSKESVIRELEEQGVFTITYRLTDSGEPVYANMKITRMPGGNRIIMGISIIDSQMKQQEQQAELKKEQTIMARILALSDSYLTLYTVDPVTGRYTETTAAPDYAALGISKSGADFFAQMRIDTEKYIHPEDRAAFLKRATKENILREVREQGSFIARYRLLVGGEARPVIFKVAAVREGREDKLIIGVRTIQPRREALAAPSRP